VALVGVQFDGEAVLGQTDGAAQIFETGQRVAIGEDEGGIDPELKPLLQPPLAQMTGPFIGVGG